MNEITEQLGFSQVKQDACLGHLLTNDQFFLKVKDFISPACFANKWSQKVYKFKLDFYAKHKRIPAIIEIQNLSDFQIEDQGTKNAMVGHIGTAQQISLQIQLDGILSELNTWMRTHILKNGMREAHLAYERKDTDKALYILQKSIENAKASNVEGFQREIFSNYISEIEANNKEYEIACGFGLNCFDRLLTPNAKAGSLLAGDTTVMLAPANVGKSSCLITVARHNIVSGKKVMYIPHEGRVADLKEKFMCCLLNKPNHWLRTVQNESENERLTRLAEISMFTQMLDKWLVFVPMYKPGLTVEEVMTVIQQAQDAEIAKTGVGFDLLVNDYPAKLTSNAGKGGHNPRRIVDDEVYGNFVQIALVNKFHALLAVQVNREGAKLNKGIGQNNQNDEERLLVGEDIAESYGVVQSATNIVTINRSRKAAAENRLTYYIDKSRSSETGWAIACRSNFLHATTHSDQLGATYYQSTSSYGTKIDQFISKYKNQKISEQDLLKVL